MMADEWKTENGSQLTSPALVHPRAIPSRTMTESRHILHVIFPTASRGRRLRGMWEGGMGGTRLDYRAVSASRVVVVALRRVEYGARLAVPFHHCFDFLKYDLLFSSLVISSSSLIFHKLFHLRPNSVSVCSWSSPKWWQRSYCKTPSNRAGDPLVVDWSWTLTHPLTVPSRLQPPRQNASNTRYGALARTRHGATPLHDTMQSPLLRKIRYAHSPCSIHTNARVRQDGSS